MDILKARDIGNGVADEDSGFFDGPEDFFKTIDSIEYGDSPWESFTVRYTGHVDNNSPPWKRHTYTVHARNTLSVVRNMLKSADFKNSFDYSPLKEFIGPNRRRWSNFMSGHWAWKEAVRSESILLYSLMY